MKRILFSVLLLFSLYSYSYSADKTCITPTKDEFYSSVSKLNPTMYKGSDKALSTILNFINSDRKKTGQFLIIANELIVGIFSDKSGMLFAGTVMFDKNNCLVPGTTTAMSIEEWVKFLTMLNLSNEDFIKIQEASNGA